MIKIFKLSYPRHRTLSFILYHTNIKEANVALFRNKVAGSRAGSSRRLRWCPGLSRRSERFSRWSPRGRSRGIGRWRARRSPGEMAADGWSPPHSSGPPRSRRHTGGGRRMWGRETPWVWESTRRIVEVGTPTPPSSCRITRVLVAKKTPLLSLSLSLSPSFTLTKLYINMRGRVYRDIPVFEEHRVFVSRVNWPPWVTYLLSFPAA